MNRVMRARLALVLPAVLLAVTAAGRADAGAWPREPGAVFLSLRSDVETGSGEIGTALYGEYGLTPRITIGFTATDYPPDETEPWEEELPSFIPPTRHRIGSFVQVALGSLEATNRFAISLGFSAPPDTIGLMAEHRIEAALHWGRGFSSRWGDGWATASAKLALARDEDDPITDLYGLVGLKPFEGWMAMLSASRYADEDGTTWKLSPSFGYQPHSKLWLVPSVRRSFDDSGETSVGLSLWLSF